MRKAVYFDITPECNLRCIHCYNAEKYFVNDNYNEISYDKAEKIIDRLYESGFNYIHFLGGEPLLSTNILKVIKYCKALGFEVSINTNALLLDDSMQSELILLGVDQIGCSLDGYDDITNDAIRGKETFYKVIKNIKALKNKKSSIQVQVVYTITNLNFNNIKLLPPLLEWLEIDVIDISLLFKAGKAIGSWKNIHIDEMDLLNAIEKFVSLSKNRGYTIQIDNRPIIAYYLKLKYSDVIIHTNIDFTTCSAGAKNVYVEADGKIHPCNFFVAIGGREKYKSLQIEMEDIYIYEQKFSDAYTSQYFTNFLAKVKAMDVRSERNDCIKCCCKDICYPCPFEEGNQMENKICLFCKEKIDNYFEENSESTITIKSRDIFNKYFSVYIREEIHDSVISLGDLLLRENVQLYLVIDALLNLQKLNIIKINIKEN